MLKNRDRTMASLDDVRRQGGRERLRDAFFGLVERDETGAMLLLNDDKLQFPTLYALQPEIRKRQLEPKLSSRNRAALKLAQSLVRHDRPGAGKPTPEQYAAMKWMLQTGYTEEDMDDEYDEVMDLLAILLVREYRDKDCLRTLEEIIFQRHRRGLYTHDAEWAYFECRNPDCLVRLANRLRSPFAGDAELARGMLGFLPCFETGSTDAQEQYRCATAWIDRNRPFLRYTGEGSQNNFNPCRFEVALEYKYLQRPLPAGDAAALLSAEEQSRMQLFLQQDEGTKVLLSDYSDHLHHRRKAAWEKWMQIPLQEQIKIARRAAGEEGLP